MKLYPVLCLVSLLPRLALTQTWQPIPLNAHGGEGCQVILTNTVAETDGNLLFLGTDVGGLFRSTDGAANWAPCNIDLGARGVNDIAIDPRNKNRVIACGCGSSSADNGLWISKDMGSTWQLAQAWNYDGYRDPRRQIAFDPASYDSALGYCKRVYWSTGTPSGGTAALLKSTDGGSTWSTVNSSMGASIVKVHPVSGVVYAGNSTGFYRSTNGGVNFTPINSLPVTAMDVISTQPDRVYIGTSEPKIHVSTDSGLSFTVKTTTGIPADRDVVSFSVSRQNAAYMVVAAMSSTTCNLYRSTDGGSTWSAAAVDTTGAWVNDSPRKIQTCWHPADNNIVYSWFNSINAVKSSNAGANFTLTNKGNNGICIETLFAFAPGNPNIVAIGAMDFNGMQTMDGGVTWKRLGDMGRPQTSTNTFGWIRGAFSPDANVIYGSSSATWSPYHSDLRRSSDRAVTWGTTIPYTSLSVENARIFTSYCSPTNPDICFYYRYRSTNRGLTWTAMTNCKGVVLHDRSNGDLIGTSNNGTSATIVRSSDGGVTWNTVAGVTTSWLTDVAYDHVNKLYYVTTDTRNRLQQFNANTGSWTDISSRVPADQKGTRLFWSVACDPVKPEVVYVVGAAGSYRRDTAVCRSTDKGLTFLPLTRASRHNNSQFGKDGGNSAITVRVHPTTREAWVGTSCYGLWKIGAPPSEPVSLLTVTPSAGKVDLHWSTFPGASFYRVYRSVGSNTSYSWLITGWGSTYYSNTGLTSGTTYYYKVSALDAAKVEISGSMSAERSVVAP